MMARCWRELVCRLTGKKCGDAPASSVLRSDMKERSSRVSAQTIEIKQQRNVMEQSFLPDQSRERGKR